MRASRWGLCPPACLSIAVAFALLLGASPSRAQSPPQPGQAPRPPSMFGGMMSGLQIPPPTPPSAASLRVSEELDEAKRQDSGRGLEWVWIDVEGGFEQLGLQTFNAGTAAFLAGLVPTSASGGVVGVGVGARLLYFTLLLRGRVGIFDIGELYRLGLEGGFHVPLGRVEPRVALAAGYAQMANLHDVVGGAAGSAIALRGFHARVGAGLDYYVTPVFSIGGDVSGELLGLTRPALSMAQVTNIQKSAPANLQKSADLLLQSSSGWGGTLAATALLGLHF